MNKIWLVIQREYLIRVKKKSFVVMSILGPLLIAVMYGVIIWAAISSSTSSTKLLLLDESGHFNEEVLNTSDIGFSTTTSSLADAMLQYPDSEKEGLLYIPKLDLEVPDGIVLFTQKGISAVKERKIEKAIEQHLRNIKLAEKGIDQDMLASANTKVSITTKKGENESSAGAATIFGLVGGFIVYFFVFFYGIQVMRGVIEEKTNRIVEVIVQSLKPFQLMMGKVVGIAAVGVTQILIWVVLGTVIVSAFSAFIGLDQMDANSVQEMSSQLNAGQELDQQVQMRQAVMESGMIQAISTINFPVLIGGFFIYFLFGYLTYAALFGAIGSAVDNETDTQQFMLPVTLPLIVAIALSTAVMNDPNSSLAFWMSIFPLTSPITMMIRLPFIGFNWEVALSMTLLIATFFGTTWMAARIYRIGILMYGKKITYKELSKWMFHS